MVAVLEWGSLDGLAQRIQVDAWSATVAARVSRFYVITIILLLLVPLPRGRDLSWVAFEDRRNSVE